jgi:hypothetical protein
MNKVISTKPLILAAFILTLLGFNSCSDNPGSGNIVSPSPSSRDGAIDLSYSSSPRSQNFLDNSGDLVLDTAKVLIKDIKLNVANSNQQHNFKTGPYVLYLNMQATPVIWLGTSYIPIGTYDKVIFKIHKLNPNEPVLDPDFAEGQRRFSVVVKGRYNGNAFIFKSDRTALQQLTFRDSLVVTGTNSNITIQAGPYMWFLNAANEYMNPDDPQNRNEIEHNIMENIRQNFRAFQDNDKNGKPD